VRIVDGRRVLIKEDIVFLRNKHCQSMQAKQAQNILNEGGFVDLPLNTRLNEQTLFKSEINLSPNEKIKINHSMNNKYDIFMQNEYFDILHFVINHNISIPIYLRSLFVSFCDIEQIKVSQSAKRILFEENAGGCSEFSEAFSFEVLRQCFDAKLIKTEMSIKYWSNHWKKTDYLIKMNEIKIGVSVTRAMKFCGIFNKKDAMKLLKKKFIGINESSIGVFKCDEWQRQILHIWTTDNYIEEILHETFLKLLLTEPDLVSNTVIVVTVASDDCEWLFYQSKYMKNMK